MSNLVVEILLRLVKPAMAAVLGLLVYVAATAYGVPGSFHLLLMCWTGAGVFILLVQESPL